jgi:hypothetical protein
MKKNNKRQRKLRKCELGIKTKSFNKGHNYIMTSKGLQPVRNDKERFFPSKL